MIEFLLVMLWIYGMFMMPIIIANRLGEGMFFVHNLAIAFIMLCVFWPITYTVILLERVWLSSNYVKRRRENDHKREKYYSHVKEYTKYM